VLDLDVLDILVRDGDSPLGRSALRALAEIDEERARATLSHALTGDGSFTALAIQSLARHGSKAQPYAVAAIVDPERRRSAVAVLGRLGTPACRARLRPLVIDSDPPMRRAVAAALHRCSERDGELWVGVDPARARRRRARGARRGRRHRRRPDRRRDRPPRGARRRRRRPRRAARRRRLGGRTARSRQRRPARRPDARQRGARRGPGRGRATPRRPARRAGRGSPRRARRRRGRRRHRPARRGGPGADTTVDPGGATLAAGT
jgi:hypothetical protein